MFNSGVAALNAAMEVKTTFAKNDCYYYLRTARWSSLSERIAMESFFASKSAPSCALIVLIVAMDLNWQRAFDDGVDHGAKPCYA